MKNRFKLIDVYLCVGILCTVAVFTALFVTNGEFLSEIVWDAKHDLFIDFTGCQGDYRGQVSYGFFYILGRFIPDGLIEDSQISRWSELFLVIFLVICVVIIQQIINDELNESKGKKLLFLLLFFVSQPFAFACIKAGNTLFVSLMLMVAAMYLKEKPDALSRETALLCIALASDLKLAPAIFGLFYIREKRYKEAVRLLIYGLIFVVAPLFIFGGIDRYMEVLTEHAGLISPRPETIVGVIIELSEVLGLGGEIGLKIGNICSYAYLIMVVVFLFLHKRSWKPLFMMTTILIIFLNMSYPYTLCYLIIPMVAFFEEERDNMNVKNGVYAVLLALIFTTYPLLRIDWPTATFITNYFCLYIMVTVLSVDIIIEIVRDRKKRDY